MQNLLLFACASSRRSTLGFPFEREVASLIRYFLLFSFCRVSTTSLKDSIIIFLPSPSLESNDEDALDSMKDAYR